MYSGTLDFILGQEKDNSEEKGYCEITTKAGVLGQQPDSRAFPPSCLLLSHLSVFHTSNLFLKAKPKAFQGFHSSNLFSLLKVCSSLAELCLTHTLPCQHQPAGLQLEPSRTLPAYKWPAILVSPIRAYRV